MNPFWPQKIKIHWVNRMYLGVRLDSAVEEHHVSRIPGASRRFGEKVKVNTPDQVQQLKVRRMKVTHIHRREAEDSPPLRGQGSTPFLGSRTTAVLLL